MKLNNLLNNNRILIIDVESTCDDDKTKTFTNEIIEIGLAIYDNGKIKSLPSIIMKPEKSIITPFCTKLTSITKDFIEENGISVKEGYLRLNGITKNFTKWASYGFYDKNMFDKMKKLYNINFTMPINHINIRELFSRKILKSENPQDAPNNPKDSLKKIGKEFVGTNHRGDADAKNIAILYGELIRNKEDEK